MTYYLDSSAVIRRVFKSEGYFKSFSGWPDSVTSVLLSIECYRTLDRLRLEGRLDDEDVMRARTQLQNILDSIHVISLDDEIAALAQSSFPTVVKPLDSLHLATALIWREERGEALVLVSHDRQMQTAFRALGMELYQE